MGKKITKDAKQSPIVIPMLTVTMAKPVVNPLAN
jgi:hypothetical protein